MSGAIDTLLSSYPPGVQELARATRKKLRAWLPGAEETIDVSARLLAYSYGPGYRGAVCTLILSKSGVKLGLFHGASLDDPHGLLGGRGSVHRHIAIGGPEDLEQQGVRELIDGARALCRKRLEREILSE